MIFVVFLRDVCEISDVLKVIYFVTELLRILFIIVPIGLILMLSVDFVKNVIAGNVDDMKKNFNIALKRLIMIVVLFLVPTIVKFAIGLLGDLGVPYSNCLTNANLSKIAVFEAEERLEEERKAQEDEATKNSTSSDISGGSSNISS